MSSNPSEAIIAQRITQLRSQWKEFTQTPDSRLYIWEIEEEELPMLNFFIENENTENGSTPDLFLIFRSPFTAFVSYPEILLEELKNLFQQEQEDFLEKPSDILLQFPEPPITIDDFVNTLNELVYQLKELSGYLSVCLIPEEIQDTKEWEKWLVELLKAPAFSNYVRFMVVESEEEEPLDTLYEEHRDKIVRTRANLNMLKAMEEALAAQAMQSPEDQFNYLFFELGQASSKSQLEKVEKLGQQAILLTQQHLNWEHLQIATLFSMATAYLNIKDTKSAIHYADQAQGVAQFAFENEHPGGSSLIVSSYFYKASILVQNSDFEGAAKIYEQVPNYLQEDTSALLHIMEAWRMAGYCYEKNQERKQAWVCNLEAFDIIEQLDEDTRKNTPIHCIGQALLRLIEQLGNYDWQNKIIEKMDLYAGIGWQERAC